MRIALSKEGSTVSAAFLITGCCIGAGMIGLPVKSALAGFLPTSIAMAICYFFATATGLLILEATLWFDRRVNLISLAEFGLGRGGKIATWSLFLFLFYCLFVAYIDGGGEMFTTLLSAALHKQVPRLAGILSLLLLVGGIAYAGTRVVSIFNRVFLLVLIVSYLALVVSALPHINATSLLHHNLSASIATLPILLICFGYQNLVPTLIYYVRKNVGGMRLAIFIGTLIPFLIYSLWNFSILGILPNTGSSSFTHLVSQTDRVADLLQQAAHAPSVLFFAKTFSFFAILMPFIANALSFKDFLKDGLKIAHESKYDLLVYLLVFIPPALLSCFQPHLFLKALRFAGGFADVLLLGVMPVLVIWIGRYRKKMEGPYRVSGGKPFLLTVLLLSVGFLITTHLFK